MIEVCRRRLCSCQRQVLVDASGLHSYMVAATVLSRTSYTTPRGCALHCGWSVRGLSLGRLHPPWVGSGWETQLVEEGPVAFSRGIDQSIKTHDLNKCLGRIVIAEVAETIVSGAQV